MLDAPRELLARALLPLKPLEPPLMAFGFAALEVPRLPAPLAERSLVPALGLRWPWAPPARLLAPPCWEAWAPPARLPAPVPCWEAWAPRDPPPYLLFVALSP